MTIYDGNDYALFDVESREADDEAKMDGYTALELARFIIGKLGGNPEGIMRPTAP